MVDLTLAEPDEKSERPNVKEMGAYYTDAQIAEFLVRWAIRMPCDTVMDPSFGGGVFLRAACQRLQSLGGDSGSQVFGVEIDDGVHRRIGEKLVDEFRIRSSNLLRADFFDVDLGPCGPVDAVVGNPPFIRYQRFKGDSRRRALHRATTHSVSLSELSSSWAPFVVHSVAMLKEGGRLGFVIPMEIGYASYASPVIEFLRTSFKDVTFLTFEKKLFPNLNEDTLLVLADAKGGGSADFYLRDFHHARMLHYQQLDNEYRIFDRRRIDAKSLAKGDRRLSEYVLPVTMRDMYSEIKIGGQGTPLGSVSDVGIGYVTGNNKFFHLNPQTADEWKIPSSYLRPAVRRGRSLQSLCFTSRDWESGLKSEDSSYLLHIGKSATVSQSVKSYIRLGEETGVAAAYKCRTRVPWYRVPHVHQPDAFLTYMSGDTPKLVTNDAMAVAPNSLLNVRIRDRSTIDKNALAVLWLTSLTRLSAEIEGHSLGGGMLKIEPGEAEKVLIPHVDDVRGGFDPLIRELDALVRNGKIATARALADETILMDRLGFSRNDCRLLAGAANIMRERRYGRSMST